MWSHAAHRTNHKNLENKLFVFFHFPLCLLTFCCPPKHKTNLVSYPSMKGDIQQAPPPLCCSAQMKACCNSETQVKAVEIKKTLLCASPTVPSSKLGMGRKVKSRVGVERRTSCGLVICLGCDQSVTTARVAPSRTKILPGVLRWLKSEAVISCGRLVLMTVRCSPEQASLPSVHHGANVCQSRGSEE